MSLDLIMKYFSLISIFHINLIYCVNEKDASVSQPTENTTHINLTTFLPQINIYNPIGILSSITIPNVKIITLVDNKQNDTQNQFLPSDHLRIRNLTRYLCLSLSYRIKSIYIDRKKAIECIKKDLKHECETELLEYYDKFLIHVGDDIANFFNITYNLPSTEFPLTFFEKINYICYKYDEYYKKLSFNVIFGGKIDNKLDKIIDIITEVSKENNIDLNKVGSDFVISLKQKKDIPSYLTSLVLKHKPECIFDYLKEHKYMFNNKFKEYIIFTLRSILDSIILKKSNVTRDSTCTSLAFNKNKLIDIKSSFKDKRFAIFIMVDALFEYITDYDTLLKINMELIDHIRKDEMKMNIGNALNDILMLLKSKNPLTYIITDTTVILAKKYINMIHYAFTKFFERIESKKYNRWLDEHSYYSPNLHLYNRIRSSCVSNFIKILKQLAIKYDYDLNKLNNELAGEILIETKKMHKNTAKTINKFVFACQGKMIISNLESSDFPDAAGILLLNLINSKIIQITNNPNFSASNLTVTFDAAVASSTAASSVTSTNRISIDDNPSTSINYQNPEIFTGTPSMGELNYIDIENSDSEFSFDYLPRNDEFPDIMNDIKNFCKWDDCLNAVETSFIFQIQSNILPKSNYTPKSTLESAFSAAILFAQATGEYERIAQQVGIKGKVFNVLETMDFTPISNSDILVESVKDITIDDKLMLLQYYGEEYTNVIKGDELLLANKLKFASNMCPIVYSITKEIFDDIMRNKEIVVVGYYKVLINDMVNLEFWNKILEATVNIVSTYYFGNKYEIKIKRIYDSDPLSRLKNDTSVHMTEMYFDKSCLKENNNLKLSSTYLPVCLCETYVIFKSSKGNTFENIFEQIGVGREPNDEVVLAESEYLVRAVKDFFPQNTVFIISSRKNIDKRVASNMAIAGVVAFEVEKNRIEKYELVAHKFPIVVSKGPIFRNEKQI